MIAFKATQKLFEELASAKYDLFGGSEKAPVVIASSDLQAFAGIISKFDIKPA